MPSSVRLIDKLYSICATIKKQLYVPELFLELNDNINKKNSPTLTNDYLKPPAQLALLYHLQVAPFLPTAISGNSSDFESLNYGTSLAL